MYAEERPAGVPLGLLETLRTPISYEFPAEILRIPRIKARYLALYSELSVQNPGSEWRQANQSETRRASFLQEDQNCFL
jgi:hypothetical protein